MRVLAGILFTTVLALLAAGCGGGSADPATLGAVPRTPRRHEPAKITVDLASTNAARIAGTAVLTPARADSQKTRVNVSLDSRPAQHVTVEIDVGRCSNRVSLQPQTVLGAMEGRFASWRTPSRLVSLLSASTAVVVRTPRARPGGPVAACGPIRGR